MNLINNNPYRILGLPLTASEREIAKQISTLGTYAEMGKSKSFDTDFSFLPSVNRSTHTIEEAKKQIEQSESKLLHSLFWFWKNNSVDELALDVLKEGNINKAIEIWEKSVFTNKHKVYKPVILFEDLIRQSTNWSEQNDEDHSLKKNGNEYTIERKKETSSSIPSIFVEFNFDEDWTIECDSEWKAGTDNAGYGILFGREKSSYFSFSISANGYYSCGKTIEWNYDFLIPWKKNAAIENCSINHLQLKKIDNKIGLFINGIFVDSIQAETFFGKSFGFTVTNNQTIIFRNFKFCKLIEDDIYGEGINVSSKNFSSIKNLSTLYLSLATNNGAIQSDYFKKGVSLANKFFSSDKMEEYAQLIAGDKYIYSTETALQFFINNIIESVKILLDKTDGITTTQFIKSFSNYPIEGRQCINGKFITKPILNIEKEIEIAEAERKITPNRSIDVGKNLISKSSLDIMFLKSALGENDLQYQMISDKLALEITQCAIDYFNTTKNDEPGLPLYKIAVDIAISERAKERTIENLDSCIKWISDKPVEEAIADITNQLSSTISRLRLNTASKSDAENLIKNSRPKLIEIKSILGSTNEQYIRISSEVVSIILACMVNYINDTSQRGIEPSSVNIVESMDHWEMDGETRTRYIENKNTLRVMFNRRTSIPSPRSDGGFCYIATMVYRNSEAPEVLILKKFRDAYLDKFSFGRMFIRAYYKYSPRFVERFKNNERVNKTIRYLLDSIIKILPK